MKGVVAAGSELTAEAGAWSLREGGNAFDAAVCCVLASFTSESLLTGMGAGGFLLAHTADNEDHLLDFFVEAGGRGLQDSEKAELVAAEVVFDQTPQIFNVGPASCGVPGTPAGIWEMSERFCSMPLAELVKPAIRYAREGITVDRAQAYIYRLLRAVITAEPESCALYAPGGNLLDEGDTFRFPELADALERFAAEGPDWIYRGDGAQAVSEWLIARGGMVSADDMEAYRVIERDPVRTAYRGREVLTNAPPSSGGILIAYALALLERTDTGDLSETDALVLLTEVMGETNRAREGDFHLRLHEPRLANWFLSDELVSAAAARIEQAVAGGAPTKRGSAAANLGSTTHLSVLDSEGNAAAITCSNGTSSGVVVPGTGIHLNNMLGEEDLNPLGFHRHEPGTRVTSMMAPTTVLRDGRIELSLGSAGSNRLRSAILQVIRTVVDAGADVRDAVERGRMHYEAGILHAEPGFDARALDELERRYRLVRWRERNLYFGGVQAVRRDASSGELSGAGDPRRGGAVVVVE
jgi:gamma-glutamyltranspeptidase / glutathione hydrolase